MIQWWMQFTALVGPLLSIENPFVQFYDQGVNRNISVKLFLIWNSGSGDVV